MTTCKYCGKVHSNSLPLICSSCLAEYQQATRSHFNGTLSEYFGTTTTPAKPTMSEFASTHNLEFTPHTPFSAVGTLTYNNTSIDINTTLLHHVKPFNTAEALNSIALDCADILNADSYEFWALGQDMNPNSPEVQALYEQVTAQYMVLDELLGSELLLSLVYSTSRIEEYTLAGLRRLVAIEDKLAQSKKPRVWRNFSDIVVSYAWGLIPSYME